MTDLNKYHDVGYNTLKSENNYKTRVRIFFENVKNGKYCDVYDDKCFTNPFKTSENAFLVKNIIFSNVAKNFMDFIMKSQQKRCD